MKRLPWMLILFFLVTGQVMAKGRFIANDASVGCKDSGYLKKLYDYAHEKDTAAFRDAYLSAVSEGICTKFAKGEKVTVIDTKALAGQVKVRGQGEKEAFWVILDDIE